MLKGAGDASGARLATQVVMQAEAEKAEDTLSSQTHMGFEALLSGALILDWGNNPLICDQEVKKSLESDYPGPETPALRPIHGFATAISRKPQAAEPTDL